MKRKAKIMDFYGIGASLANDLLRIVKTRLEEMNQETEMSQDDVEELVNGLMDNFDISDYDL
jgi:ribosomal protein S13